MIFRCITCGRLSVYVWCRRCWEKAENEAHEKWRRRFRDIYEHGTKL
jgi:hypothetical protein